MICVATCTGGRRELFSLCVRWVERQTRKPDLWLVGTDIGGRPDDLPDYAHHVPLPRQLEKKFVCRAHRSLANLLSVVPAGMDVVIFEDDDWYSPDYVEVMEHGLSKHRLVACDRETRYHLGSRRYSVFVEKKPANAGSVGMRNDAILQYTDHLCGDIGGDNRAWNDIGGVRIDCRRVAIKGVGTSLPGRLGATAKHDPMFVEAKNWSQDPDLSVFRSMVGNDFQHYERLFPQCMRQHEPS